MEAVEPLGSTEKRRTDSASSAGSTLSSAEDREHSADENAEISATESAHEEQEEIVSEESQQVVVQFNFKFRFFFVGGFIQRPSNSKFSSFWSKA